MVADSLSSNTIPKDVMGYVKDAIQRGDKLPNSQIKPRRFARRRALIIAPQYADIGSEYPRLPSTANDVKLIHETLVMWGYEHSNIRVLCDVCRGFNGRADPTRENILDSLEWLVRDTHQGDYRFLHFSGHGERLLSNSSTGKEARIVRTITEVDMLEDYELVAHRFPRRIKAKIIPMEERVYYNEAIITKPSESKWGDNPENASKIWDSELNAWLSKLPEGSTITCVMDCCASGRILNANTKLLGGGLRTIPCSGMYYNGASFTHDGRSQVTTHQTTRTSINDPSPRGAVRIPGICITPHKAVTSTRNHANTPIAYPTSKSTVVMLEKIPKRERNMDHIRAQLFAWSSCHQRQLAWESSKWNAGLLTYFFSQSCRRLIENQAKTKPVTYEQLFETVSNLVSKGRATYKGGPESQFVQLWTSSRRSDQGRRDWVLKFPVVI